MADGERKSTRDVPKGSGAGRERRGQPAHRPGQPGAAEEERPGPSPHSPNPAGPHPPYDPADPPETEGKSQRKVKPTPPRW